MNFLTPWMLWGGLAAGIPIAIHFFFRSRYRTVPWAAMKFLLAAIEQTSRRLRFQELLLLVLRCLLLAILALAFARPIGQALRATGRGDAVDAVFVFDVSGTMDARQGPKTRLALAQEEAVKILEQLPAHSTVQIVASAGTVDTPAENVGPRSPSNLDQAKHLIGELRTTSLASNLEPGVRLAADLLASGQSPNKELYIFTDHQAQAWRTAGDSVSARLQRLQEKATVALIRCGDRPAKNAGVVAIVSQSGVPRPGSRVGFAVLVRNSTNEALEDLKVSLTVDGQDKLAEPTPIARLGPNETRAIPVSVNIDRPGLRILTARLTGDDMDFDNRFDQVLHVREAVNVLVVDGNWNEREPAKSSSFFLAHALQPVKDLDRAKYHVQPRVVPARLASPALLAKQDLCIFVNVPIDDKIKTGRGAPADFVRELANFVRQGKSLAIFPGDNVQPEIYNRLLGEELGLLPMAIEGFRTSDEKKPATLARGTFNLPAFSSFKEDDYYQELSKVESWKMLGLAEPRDADGASKKVGEGVKAEPLDKPLEPKDAGPEPRRGEGGVTFAASTVVVRFSDGRPAAGRRQFDAGEVWLWGIAADPGGSDPKTFQPIWTDWPFHLGVYVPVVDGMVSHLMHGQSQSYNVVAGEAFAWHPPAAAGRVFSIRQESGEPTIRLGYAEKVGGRDAVRVPGLPRSGVVRIESKATTTDSDDAALSTSPVAVAPDSREGEDLTALSNGELDALLGFTPIHATAGAQGASLADRLQREWTPWVLWLALIWLTIEGLFAWWCGRG